MNPDQHRTWLVELAAEDQRRRRRAEPQLARKEAFLRHELGKLKGRQAAIQELEADLEAARHEADTPDHGSGGE